MYTEGLVTAASEPSIVAWFALLVVVFAAFVVLGLCQSLRQPAKDDDTKRRSHPAPARGPRSHPKE